MKLKDIYSISGKPGLYKFISQGRNGIIVEGFTDKKRLVIYSTTKVSALKDIAIFTEVEDVPLKDVMKKLYEKENGKQTINHKATNEELKAVFEEIIPEYDRDRVYTSDIKKVISWYNLLIEHNLLDPNETDDEEKTVEKEEQEKESSKETKNESSEEEKTS